MSKHNLLVRLSALCAFFIILLTPFSPLYSINLQLKLPFEKGSTFILTRGYNTQTTHVGKDNFALDFTAGGCDSYDAPVLAATAGVIERVSVGHVHGEVESYGNSIVINHGDGILSRYGHLNQVFVTSSEQVVQGQIIGTQGNTGSVWGTGCKAYPGTHLHFVMYTRGEDGTLTPYLPEPMSGYTDFVKGKEYTSDNEIIADVIPESIITENSPELNSNELNQTEQTQKVSFIKTTWNRLSTFVIQSIKRVLSVAPRPEQQGVLEGESGATRPTVETVVEGTQVAEAKVDARFVQTEIPVSFVKGAKQVQVLVEIENTGTAVLEKNTVSLNVVGGRVPNIMWYHPTWTTQLRPIVLSQTVQPGQKVTVPFTLTIPTVDRRFRLQLVRSVGGSYVQLGTVITTVVLSEVVVPVKEVVVLPPPTSSGTPSQSDSLQVETESPVSPPPETVVEQQPVVVYRGGGGGGPSSRSSGEEDDEPTTTPEVSTSTDPTPTSTPTSTDPLPELSDLGITAPVDPLEVVYTNESEYIFAGTSDEYTETIVITKDDVVIATTTPSGGVWEISTALTTGTQSFVLYGTASEERQTNSTTIIVVYDAEAPFVDIQLLSVGEGSIVVDLITFDDSPVSSYTVEFFDVVEFFSEPTECVEGLFVFEAPALQYYVEGGELYVEIIGTNYVCGFIVDTQTVEEPVVSAPYNEDYSISVRAKGIDVAGNESSWWYSAVPLAVRDLGDVGGEL